MSAVAEYICIFDTFCAVSAVFLFISFNSVNISIKLSTLAPFNFELVTDSINLFCCLLLFFISEALDNSCNLSNPVPNLKLFLVLETFDGLDFNEDNIPPLPALSLSYSCFSVPAGFIR